VDKPAMITEFLKRVTYWLGPVISCPDSSAMRSNSPSSPSAAAAFSCSNVAGEAIALSVNNKTNPSSVGV
jgi:hypothetical protein